MSSAKQGLRRASIGGLSAAVGATVMFGLAVAPANAATPAPGLTETTSPTPNVTQGADNQTAGDLNYQFKGMWSTGDKITLALSSVTGENCATAADIAKAVSFSSTPKVTATAETTGDTAPPIANVTTASSTQCGVAGVKDEVVITLGAGGGAAANTYDLAISGITYNVGAKTPTGDITVFEGTGSTPASDATTPPGSAVNANVVNTSFTFIPRESATPGSTANMLGTATFKESSAEAYFPANATTKVVLDLSAGTFTDGVTPTINVPSGYTVAKDSSGTAGTPETPTDAADHSLYTFYVKAPATVSAPATVTVSGLKADAPGTAGTSTTPPTGMQTVTITPTVETTTGDAMDALNVVAQDRTGGQNRYETAAKLFNDQFGHPAFTPGVTDVVLSGGQKFPDALSANYLAKALGTGTLLTKADSLPDATKHALINNGIDTVYITGQSAAVSQAVQDEIESMHVGGDQFSKTIQVVRLGGANRYATNQAVNEFAFGDSGATNNTAIIAAGTAPYDSLAVGPVVYKQGYPLVLTKGTIGDQEESQLNNYGVRNVVIVGGISVVTQAGQDKLAADGYNVVRISGTNRWATAADVAMWGTEGVDANHDGKTNDGLANTDQGLDSDTSYVTSSSGHSAMDYADALVGGPVAGSVGSPILVARGASTVGAELTGYLAGKTVASGNAGEDVSTLHALGLFAATTNGLLDDAAAAIDTK